MKDLKIFLQKFLIRNVEIHRKLFGFVNTHSVCHFLIHILISLYTIRRMYIQGNTHPTLMKLLQETLRIREKITVPGISGPSISVFRINFRHMPVHVDNPYRKWNLLFFETIHQLQISFLRIWIVAAPPVSKGKPGNHRRSAAKMIVIF